MREIWSPSQRAGYDTAGFDVTEGRQFSIAFGYIEPRGVLTPLASENFLDRVHLGPAGARDLDGGARQLYIDAPELRRA